jgi:hypothetical protein
MITPRGNLMKMNQYDTKVADPLAEYCDAIQQINLPKSSSQLWFHIISCSI